MKVRAKKHLGQHFLKDLSVSQRIADAITEHNGNKNILEIGPGTGALTQFLVKHKDWNIHVVELDKESVEYLKGHYFELENRIHFTDFLKEDTGVYFNNEPYAVIGNFPYNISSQIVFKVIDNREVVPEMVGMFQKEVAWRISRPPGSKEYGILSVLAQAYYDCEYLFTVDEDVFIPPPKVKSGVIRLTRKKKEDDPSVSFSNLKKVVKQAFNQRRKTLRNSLKSLLPEGFTHDLLSKRPEQLGVKEFVELTTLLLEQ